MKREPPTGFKKNLGNDYVKVHGEVRRRTEKAIEFVFTTRVGNHEVPDSCWLPLSQVSHISTPTLDSRQPTEVILTRWMAEAKGLSYTIPH